MALQKIAELEKSLFHCGAKPSGKIDSLTHDDKTLYWHWRKKAEELEARLKNVRDALEYANNMSSYWRDLHSKLEAQIKIDNINLEALEAQIPTIAEAKIFKAWGEAVAIGKDEKELLKKVETWI